jgi:hypothetical protein
VASGWATCKVDVPGSLDLCFITEGSLRPIIERWKSLGIPTTAAWDHTKDTKNLSVLVVLRHKLRRARPCVFTAQHGQRERLATSLTISRRRRVAIEFGTWRSGRSGGASGSITFGKGKFREENFGN